MYEQFVNEIIGRSKLQPEPVTGISFCIPTNGSRPEKTNLTIKSIQKEMGDFPHEIIIAGDVSEFRDNCGVTLVDKSNEAHSRKVAALRNAAADNSRFETIVWCDDDIIIGSGWLQNTLEFSSNSGWNVLGNKILNPDGTRHWDRATLNPHLMVNYAHPEYDKKLYQTSGFLLIRKKVFNRIRWDEQCLIRGDQEGKISEDVKFSLDLIKNGFNLSFNQNSEVWHNDNTYTEFNNQTVKKEIITEKLNIDFFPPVCRRFKDISENE